jgi:hypothetical protein
MTKYLLSPCLNEAGSVYGWRAIPLASTIAGSDIQGAALRRAPWTKLAHYGPTIVSDIADEIVVSVGRAASNAEEAVEAYLG